MLRLRSLSVVVLLLAAACGDPPPAKAPDLGGTAPDAGAAAPGKEEVRPTSEVKPTSEIKPAPDTSAEVKPAAKSDVVVATPPTLKVLDTGAAPKKALRYVFKAGTTERAEMDMRVGVAMGNGMKIDMPTVRTTMRLEGKEVTPEGDLRLAFDTEKVEVLDDKPLAPELRGKLEKELGGLVGLKGKSRISPRGVASEVGFELPATTPEPVRAQVEGMQDGIRNMYVPLPEEPVGKGARWEVGWHLPVNGAAMDVKVLYAVQKVDDTGLTADITTTFAAPPEQTMNLPGLPPEAKAVLVSLSGKGNGKASPVFAKLVGNGENRVTMATAFRVTAGPQKVDQKTNTDMTVVIRPAKAGVAAKPTAPATKK